jgi:very-short-patch-repair endonuclease
LAEHLPELAYTFSVPEERFLALIDEAGIPSPEVNAFVEGLMVDCVWRDARLVVELDGHAAHDGHAAIETDRRREMKLRRAGLRVVRYTWQQVTREGELIVGEIRAELRLEAD